MYDIQYRTPRTKEGLHDIVANTISNIRIHTISSITGEFPNHSMHEVLKVYLHGITHTTLHPLAALHSITGFTLGKHNIA